MKTENASLGMQAVLLIRLVARRGQMVAVAALAGDRMTVDVARAGLQALAEQGYVRCDVGPDGTIRAAVATQAAKA